MNEPVHLIDEPGHSVGADASPTGTTQWHGRGFGLSVRSTHPVQGLDERSGEAGAPAVSLSLTGSAPRWPAPDRGQRVREIRFPDGKLAMVIEDHGPGGFRIADAHLGSHSISADGASARSSPPAGLEPWRWRRLLIGQVLPLMATLNGFEILHASAVSAAGQVFALSGDPGAGKSTLAALLALSGLELMTDDVLAISLDRGGQTIAHPGSTWMSFRAGELSLARRLQRSGIAEAIGRDDKAHVLLGPPAGPLPLTAIYWLRRSSGTIIESPARASVVDLMKTTYCRYLRTPQRLTRRLEVQAALAENVAFIPVNIADDLPPDALAEKLHDHIARLVRG